MQKLILTKRDIALLEALWRWKALSTGAIWKRFFPIAKPITTYSRLRKLRKAGFIQWHVLDPYGSTFVWVLTDKGYDIVRDRLPNLRNEGFRSEHINHDALTTAIHIGDWLATTPIEVELFSEQELRRVAIDQYPLWVPRTDGHRPDGYWHVPCREEKIIVALEVELTQKRDLDYSALPQNLWVKSSAIII